MTPTDPLRQEPQALASELVRMRRTLHWHPELGGLAATCSRYRSYSSRSARVDVLVYS
jgi:hypothetical protein